MTCCAVLSASSSGPAARGSWLFSKGMTFLDRAHLAVLNTRRIGPGPADWPIAVLHCASPADPHSASLVSVMGFTQRHEPIRQTAIPTDAVAVTALPDGRLATTHLTSIRIWGAAPVAASGHALGGAPAALPLFSVALLTIDTEQGSLPRFDASTGFRLYWPVDQLLPIRPHAGGPSAVRLAALRAGDLHVYGAGPHPASAGRLLAVVPSVCASPNGLEEPIIMQRRAVPDSVGVNYRHKDTALTLLEHF
jgi:hypothetical protein